VPEGSTDNQQQYSNYNQEPEDGNKEHWRGTEKEPNHVLMRDVVTFPGNLAPATEIYVSYQVVLLRVGKYTHIFLFYW
jgi:hypothetical protein